MRLYCPVCGTRAESPAVKSSFHAYASGFPVSACCGARTVEFCPAPAPRLGKAAHPLYVGARAALRPTNT